MKCEECFYYESIGDVGNCYRFPPIQDGQGENTVDNPPTVKKDRWCGEFKKKGAKK